MTPEMKPSAEERIDTAFRDVGDCLVLNEDDHLVLLSNLAEEVARAYLDGFRAAVALLREPSEGLVERVAVLLGIGTGMARPLLRALADKLVGS